MRSAIAFAPMREPVVAAIAATSGTEWETTTAGRLPSQPLRTTRLTASAQVSGYGRRSERSAAAVSAGHDSRRVASFPPWMMATRSFIARETEKGYEGVYCHWDGYPAYTGAILVEHYMDPGEIAELLSHGDMSMLGSSVGRQHDFDDRDGSETTYYGRDRGQRSPNIETKRCRLLEHLLKIAESMGCEYFYLFRRGQWEVACRGPQFFGLSDGSPFSGFRVLAFN